MRVMKLWNGNALQQARMNKGWSGEDLSEALAQIVGRQYSVQTVSAWECGREPKGFPLILALAQVLGVSHERFFAPEPSSPRPARGRPRGGSR